MRAEGVFLAQVEVVQPGGQVAEVGVGIAVFIEDVVAFDGEAQVIEAVDHGVDEGIAAVLGVAAVVLYQVEAGFDAVLVIAVEFQPLFVVVGADVGIDGAHILDRDHPVDGYAGVLDRLVQDVVHAVGGGCAAFDVLGAGAARQAFIAFDHVDQLIQAGAGVALADVKVVQPVGQVAELGVFVAVFIEDAIAVDLEAQVIKAVGHGVDQVLAEDAGPGAVVLHQVKAGLLAVLVVAVQGQPFIQVIGADVGIDRANVIHADVAVGRCVGGLDGCIDDAVHAVGGIGAFGDLGVADFPVEASVGHDGVGDAVQAGAGVGVIGVELGQPFGDLLNAGVGVAVFVLKAAVDHLEADVVDAVGNRVGQVVTAIARAAAIVLQQVKAGLDAVFIVAVQGDEFFQAVLADVGVDRQHIVHAEHAVLCHAGGLRGFEDHQVEGVGCRQAADQVFVGDATVQADVGGHGIDQLVEAGAAGAVRGAVETVEIDR